MSSKTQLNEYIKKLKKELSSLKSNKDRLIKIMTRVTMENSRLKCDIIILRSKERKWYHFF